MNAFPRRLTVSLFTAAFFLTAPSRQAQEAQPDDRFAKLEAMRVHCQNYQVWDGMSHFLMMDDPQKFNDAVAAFLKKNAMAR